MTTARRTKEKGEAPGSPGVSSRTGSIKIPCLHCGAELRRSPFTLAHNNGNAYCNQECYRAYRKGKKRNYPKRASTAPTVTKPCAFCGVPVTRRVTDARPRHFCSRSHAAKQLRKEGRIGRGSTRTIGDTSVTSSGYVYELVERDHPMADRRGYVQQHRLVMSNMVGRPLRPNETPHHKNGQRADNRPENLELWVKSQPSGQRAIDLLEWAEDIVATYRPLKPKLR